MKEVSSKKKLMVLFSSRIVSEICRKIMIILFYVKDFVFLLSSIVFKINLSFLFIRCIFMVFG